MSRSDLLNEIERLRAEMHELAGCKVPFEEVLKVSQELDKLIVAWHKYN